MTTARPEDIDSALQQMSDSNACEMQPLYANCLHPESHGVNETTISSDSALLTEEGLQRALDALEVLKVGMHHLFTTTEYAQSDIHTTTLQQPPMRSSPQQPAHEAPVSFTTTHATCNDHNIHQPISSEVRTTSATSHISTQYFQTTSTICTETQSNRQQYSLPTALRRDQLHARRA